MKSRLKSFFKYTTLIILLLMLSSVLYVGYLKFFPPVTTSLMISRCREQATGIKEIPFSFQCKWTSYESLSSNIKMAVICAEDQKFPAHNGFDFSAIYQAAKNNLESTKIKGASTISQQVAKNVFLWQGRNFLRKGLEVYFTFLIELIWGKQRILEMYLNVAETGNGLFGAEAAANYYYKKSSAQLSKYESACLAVVLPNPRKFSPLKPTYELRRRIQATLFWMRYYGGEKYLSSFERN